MNCKADTQTTQRIYVACLAAYNSGILHGEWIDLDDDVDETWRRIRNILASSPVPDVEEWAIHDFEGFGPVGLSEWESIERVHELAEFIQNHDDIGLLLLDHYETVGLRLAEESETVRANPFFAESSSIDVT